MDRRTRPDAQGDPSEVGKHQLTREWDGHRQKVNDSSALGNPKGIPNWHEGSAGRSSDLGNPDMNDAGRAVLIIRCLWPSLCGF